MFGEMLQLFKKPVTTITEKAETEELKPIGIKAGISAVIWMIISVLNAILAVVVKTKFSFSTGKTETTWKWDNIGDADIFGTIVKSLLIYLAVIAVIALIFFIISKLLKSNKDYKTMLSVSTNGLLIFAIGQVVVFLLTRIYAPLGIFVGIAVYAYTIFTIFLSFRKIVGEIDLDKYTIIITIVILILAIIAYVLLKNYISLSFLSAFGK